jgi:hypothetical protein
MKRILFVLLIPLLMFAGEKKMANLTYPNQLFTAGSDTILSAANLISNIIEIGTTEGVVVITIQSDTVAGGGSVAKDIAVYAKFQTGAGNWGVPADSVAVDSIFLGTIDSAYVNDETPWYYHPAKETWWDVFDRMKLILDPGASADSLKFSRSSVRGY